MLKIIAGPCSVDFDNQKEIDEMLKMKVNGKQALHGVRVVGLKSRTAFDPENAFVGIDIDTYEKNLQAITNGDFSSVKIHPSVEIANEIQEKHKDITIATEIVDSFTQCHNLDKFLKSNRAIVWNPAVNHLGFPLRMMASFASKNNWSVGIKNGKTLGGSFETSEIENKGTSQDKSWEGLVSYTNLIPKSRVFTIHRGVDLGNNNGYRNTPVHKLSERVKMNSGCEMFLDPSHILGPDKRDEILDFTIDSMKMKMRSGASLYDGVLIEVGTAKSDTKQHITLDELEELVRKVSDFRQL